MKLSNYCYVPTVKTSNHNLSAIAELFDTVKDLIVPRLVMRKDKKSFENFISKWGNERPYFLEVSKYPSDANDHFSQSLNDPSGNFAAQYALFDEFKSSNIIPVINENSPAKLRDILQLTLKTINTIGRIALKLDISHDFNNSIRMVRVILAMLSDEQINNTVVIIDAGKIDEAGILQGHLIEALELIDDYPTISVVFSSTSFPKARPASNHSENYPCLDPVWQFPYILQLRNKNIHALYGDCAATDPYGEQYEFDFMVKPIPYANYLLKDSLEWFSIRKGKGAEYEKFRDIAQEIRAHSNYHGDNFCYANKLIKEIAIGNKDKAGNQAYWNKLKINQHISAIIDAHQSRRLSEITYYNDEQDDWDI